jgi:hypothetical protein
MGCCNKRRATVAPAARRSPAAGPPAGQARAPGVTGQPSRVPVRYTGTRRIQVRGTATGGVYHCSASSPVLIVDVRDVAALLRTGLFTALATR